MKILFCNTTYMRWYRGAGSDQPVNGGTYVKEHRKDAEGIADADNFQVYGVPADHWSIPMENGTSVEVDGPVCMAYVSTKRNKDGQAKLLHLEKIRDCAGCTKDAFVDDVLVVFCAKNPGDPFPTVIGWYKHAYVFRKLQEIALLDGAVLYKNIVAKAEDVVLLPEEKRTWRVYRAPKDGFGFGQSNFWFANEAQSPKVKGYVESIVQKIEAYDGDNWLDFDECKNCGHLVPIKQKFCDKCGTKMFLDAKAYSFDMGELGADNLLDIARAISGKGIVGISEEEFEDLLKGAEYTAMAIGFGAGKEAASEAAEAAMQSVVTNITDQSKGILLIVSGEEAHLDMVELKKAQEAVQDIAGESVQIILCANYDDTLKGGAIRVTLVACE